MRLILLITITLSLAGHTYSQIVINEICPVNSTVLTDEDGDNSDWIELYNNSPNTVDLQGYSLSDNMLIPIKWIFPSVTIQPYSYLTVFASGKNKTETIDHWETVVLANGVWKYLVPATAVDPLWNTVGFDDSGWSAGIGGIGYGDGDDGTIITPPVKSLFIRQVFNIVDTASLARAKFNIDFDDGFVAYINGVEIARSNVGVTGTPTPFDELAYEEHEAQLYQGQAMSEWLFSEDEVKSVIVNGTNVLAIQVHNVDSFSSDMSVIPYLTFAIKDTTSYYGVPPAFIETGVSLLHTNFKLSNNGETVYLANPSGIIIDSVAYTETGVDNSIGKFQDGQNNVVYFDIPTPNATNNNSNTFAGYNSMPVISLNPGFYTGVQTTTITTTSPGAVTRYTTDGSEPNETSPIVIPVISIDSTMVIRARSFGAGKLPSKTETNSYFIDFTSTLPVVSISTHPDNFWDWNTGIYVMGPNADTVVPYFNANFWQDWEKPVHLEYFENIDSMGFEQDFGIKIHGGWSRSNDLKSLRILAKGKYGQSSLNYQLFPDKEVYRFKSFILRNSGNETNITHFRDALMHKAVHKYTHIDIQDYKPAVVFINGEYFGILNLREKISENYIAENYNIDPDSVDLLQFDGYVIAGENTNFLNMAEFIAFNDMAIQANYDSVTSMLDIENFCDYFIAQTYYVNWDWPQNNIKYWRERKPGAKWRYILTDVDMGLGLFGGNFSTNDLHRVIVQNDNYHSVIFSKLLENQQFRDYFVNRYADLINTIFLPANLKALAYAFKDSLYNEMPRHMQRWNGDFNAWENYHINGTLINFIDNRAAPARNYIEEEFALNKQVNVVLNVYPPEAGKIKISTITPESYPWSGVYFDGVPVRIEAIPNPGYEFAFWQSSVLIQTPDNNQSITLNIDTNDIFTAYFFGAPDTNRITISEINYNSANTADAGDWVELYNYGTTDVDISGWVFKDGNNAHSFVIPDNTVLYSNKYLVLCRDSLLFSSQHPSVANFIGIFNFGLSSLGENLRLYDNNMQLHTSVQYKGIDPWPTAANGLGKTLELIDPYGDLNSAYNWFAGCNGGSPGGPFVDCNTQIEEMAVNQNEILCYPNPFADKTNIVFYNDKMQYVNITIYNQHGEIIKQLINKEIEKGKYRVEFDASTLNPGIYFCRFVNQNYSSTKILNVVK